jgi:hypothetical protein
MNGKTVSSTFPEAQARPDEISSGHHFGNVAHPGKGPTSTL